MRHPETDVPVLDVPRWGHEGRPRALVEHPVGAVRERLAEDLRRRGYAVLTCAGPEAGTGCPELVQWACPAVEEADLVVSSFDDLRGRMVVRRIRSRHPERVLAP